MAKHIVTVCRSCGASIIWAKGANGKANPLDAEPSPKGNIRLTDDGMLTYLTNEAAALARAKGDELRLSHFATCPNAATHRKK